MRVYHVTTVGGDEPNYPGDEGRRCRRATSALESALSAIVSTVSSARTLIVGPVKHHRQGDRLIEAAALFGVALEEVIEYRVVHLCGLLETDELDGFAKALLTNPVDTWWCESDELHHDGATVIETGLRPGVTDREGAELTRASQLLGYKIERATMAKRFVLSSTANLTNSELETLARRVLHNEVIERWALGSLAPGFISDTDHEPAVETIRLRDLSDQGIARVAKQRRLGLNIEEMKAIAGHFAGLKRDPTDAEVETIAQTWSEHCAHKTFRSSITLRDENGEIAETVDGLLKSYLRAATELIDAPWVHSAFVDNAGIVAFDENHDIALKAETHNHPSALEPFGGANTGVGGVIRDIVGVSAKPIALTNILCFGPTDTDPDLLPDGVLHPKRVKDGVVAGVGDYGNKIGVPTIAGAVIYDTAYTTTPLVFAGCIGVLETGSHPTQPVPKDAIVVLGGAVGRDGVGGATFSSQTMAVETAEIAGSSVQIGDPVLEKGLIDVVCAASSAGLYSAITDCGAGGLSSSVGEMAATLGAEIDLCEVPLKYTGLDPWEIWLSEAQERMVMSTSNPEAILTLAARHGIDATVIGHFRDDARLLVRYGDISVVDLDCNFLHNGCPLNQLDAIAPNTNRPERKQVELDPLGCLLDLLAHPSIASKEAIVRTYDHEVMGNTIARPYGGATGDGAGNGTAVIPYGTPGDSALAIGIGVNAVLGKIDPEAMAWHVIDEAIRNAVIAGADPNQLSLLDNFAWGDPTDPRTLGALVVACRACRDASLAFGAPFVSGKDSLYNVFVHPDGTQDPVCPTLVITAVAKVASIDTIPATGIVGAGNDVWLIGPESGALGGSHLDEVMGSDHGGAVAAPDPGALERHIQMSKAIAAGVVVSAHDPSEGGIAVAATEWAFAGRLGLQLDLDPSPEVLFGEGPGRYLAEVRPTDADLFLQLAPNARRIGVATSGETVDLGGVRIDHDQIAKAWKQDL